jgi:capsular exopolysaccharide synthesis family protein
MADTTEVGLHLLDYWRVVANRKFLVISLFCLVLISAIVTTILLPKIYRASLVLEITQVKKKDVEVFDRDTRPDYDPFFQQTQFESVRQKDVVYPVIDGLKLAEKWGKRDNLEGGVYPREVAYLLFLRQLDIRQIRNTSLLEVRFDDRDRQEAVAIVDAIGRRYADLRLEEVKSQVNRGLVQLAEEVKKQESAFQNARAEVERIRKELGITEVPGTGQARQGSTPITQLVLQKKEQDLDEAKIELITRQKRLEQVRNLTPTELGNALTSMGLRDDSIQMLQNEYQTTAATLAQLRKEGYGPAHPQVAAAEARTSDLAKQLQGRLQGWRQGLEVDLNTMKARVEQMEKDVTEFRQRTVVENSDKYGVFREALRQAEQMQTIYEAVQARYKQRLIEAEIPSTPVIIRSPAEALMKPVKPSWLLNMALAVVVGGILGVSTAFFIEYLDTSVKTIDDVEKSVGLPVLGIIPKGVSPLVNEGPNSPHAEAYRILRTKIDARRGGEHLNTMTMVSGGPGEGKSTTLFNLAWIYAQSGLQCLLVDADIRRPVLHSILGMSNARGLTDMLLGDPALEEVIFSTTNPKLHFMPSGKFVPEVLGALNSPKMVDVLNELKSRYDMVFFDIPPILGVSDGALLVRHLDCVGMVVQHRRFPMEVPIRVKQTVLELGGNLLGVVLNRVNTQQHQMYGYYTTYYDYYSAPDGSRKKKRRDTESVAGAQTNEGTAKSKDIYAGSDNF